MSGGIAQLVAIGQQDAHLVGNPEISFFRSTYKRHTNFSQSVERQVIQGNVSANGMSSVRIERKGDLLSYVYLQPVKSDGTQADASIVDWTTVIDKVELLIGGQVIDTQESLFSSVIAPKVLAQNLSKSRLGGIYKDDNSHTAGFYPLRFFFCEAWQSALPLVSLSYHDVELRITWGASAASYKWECYANFAYVDTQEREFFAGQSQQIIIHQVQKAVSSGNKIQELNFNHPVKCLVAGNRSADLNIMHATNKLKLQINGTDVADYKWAHPNFGAVTSYYHTSFSDNANLKRLFLYPFCLDVCKAQPTGSLNFSRLDSARIVNDTRNSDDVIYAINYNILKLENGMGGLLYSN
jgi:hypothetical protein